MSQTHNSRVILGISSSHGDSSAAILVGGRLLAAAEEERFNRRKHYGLFPLQSIQYCLAEAGVGPKDVHIVAIPRSPSANRMAKLRFAAQHPHTFASRGLRSIFRRKQLRHSDIEALHSLGMQDARIHRTEHHIAHISCLAFMTDQAAVLSFDALGDFVSTCKAEWERGYVRVLQKQYFPHSIGYFYTALTQFLGFPHFGDEFKLMGLSPHGTARFTDRLLEMVSLTADGLYTLNPKFFDAGRLASAFGMHEGCPTLTPLCDPTLLESHLGIKFRTKGAALDQVHKDLAASVQQAFEVVATHLLVDLFRRTGAQRLGLSGGCAHNSVLVGKIPRMTPFKEVLVPPAAHDAGLSVGAAVHAFLENTVDPPSLCASHANVANVGPSIEYHSHVGAERPIITAPSKKHAHKSFANNDELFRWLAKEMSTGKIIGYAHGRLEFGPRALGNRSILCDPRGKDTKDKLNARVKHRESFRPFAASVLYEEQANWFESSMYSPYMEAVFPVKTARRSEIPAVVHADGSCRIQSITKEFYPDYHALIRAFFEITSIPMLLNTSFNDSEPIVLNRSDALNCFDHCDMDIVVVGLDTFYKST